MNKKYQREHNTIRPTTNKVKEALFNIIYSKVGELSGLRFLDLFAGTGQIGVEALEREAVSCTFADRAKQNRQATKQKLLKSGLLESAQFLFCDLTKPGSLESLERQYHIIFADPPYEMEQKDLLALFEQIEAVLVEDGLFILESKKGHQYQVHGLKNIDQRNYGDTVLSFWIAD